MGVDVLMMMILTSVQKYKKMSSHDDFDDEDLDVGFLRIGGD